MHRPPLHPPTLLTNEGDVHRDTAPDRSATLSAEPSWPDYPLGEGPLERLYEHVATGAIRVDRALELASSPEVTGQLTEAYTRAFGIHAARNAARGRWEEGFLQHRLLLAAARAARGPEARALRVRAEREGLVTASLSLMHFASGPVYQDALAGGSWLVEALDPVAERALLAESYYYLGTLHLDPYTADRTCTADYDIEHRRWLARGVARAGAAIVEGLPTPPEALRLAEGYLRRAMALSEGEYNSYAIKALIQAVENQRALGFTSGAEDLSELRKQALDEIDPMLHTARWLEVAASFENAGATLDEKRVAEVLAVPLATWIERHGRLLAAEMIVPMIALLGRRDPWAGLELVRQASGLMTEHPREQHRFKFLRRAVRLFGCIAEQQGIDLYGGLEASERILAGRSEPRVKAACLIAIAAGLCNADRELDAVALLDQAERIASDLARDQRDVLVALRADFWLGAGTNAYNANPRRLAEAAGAYDNALGCHLDLGTSEGIVDLLERLEGISKFDSQAGAIAVLRALSAHALPVELAAGEPAMAKLREIVANLTLTFWDADPEVLPLVWSVSKGHRLAATFTHGVARAPRTLPSTEQRLAELAAARSTIPLADRQEALPSNGTAGTAAFEAWLTSYVEAALYGGDSAWMRFANLKIMFDNYVADLIAPANATGAGQSLSMSDLNQPLDPRMVLLLHYVADRIDGRSTAYTILITRETVERCRILRGPFDTAPWSDGQRSATRSMDGRLVGELRCALLKDPKLGALVADAGAEALDDATEFHFGDITASLDRLRASGKDHLLVVPHGAVHFAPVHLFSRKRKPLADDWTLTYLPNLGLLSPQRRLRRRTKRAQSAGACIALGFSNREGGWSRIEEAVEEARHVASIMGVDPIIDAHATKERVVNAMKTATRVHLASHGQMDVDAPAFQMVVLHPADDEEAGRLFAYEILDLDLAHVELVTLSACETSLGRIDLSDNLRGLTSALFSAGVATIVGTLWPVESQVSERFFTELYRALESGETEIRDAFRRAQRATREDFPQYKDWGCFYLAGDWI